MSKFEYDESLQLKILTEDQVKEMHETALHVLENLGIIFAYDEALDILEKAAESISDLEISRISSAFFLYRSIPLDFL